MDLQIGWEELFCLTVNPADYVEPNLDLRNEEMDQLLMAASQSYKNGSETPSCDDNIDPFLLAASQKSSHHLEGQAAMSSMTAVSETPKGGEIPTCDDNNALLASVGSIMDSVAQHFNSQATTSLGPSNRFAVGGC